MILEVDIGNSNVKWRLRDDETVSGFGSLAHAGVTNEKINYDDLLASISSAPWSINVVTVVESERSRFSVWCVKRWGVEPGFAEVGVECAGVVNGYQDISQMGPDRWSAMVAAFNYADHDCLVVDSGSACTVDLILASGLHLGGYIVPGVELMRGALFRDTDRVKLFSINYDDPPRLGQNTLQAVSSGLQVMLMALVVVALDELLAAGAKKPVVVIAGGGSRGMISLFNEYLSGRNRSSDVGDVVLRPDIVFEGLPFVCR
ncbi:MAG: type III pantothenate kinase [Cellvibrionaceae bacterium]